MGLYPYADRYPVVRAFPQQGREREAAGNLRQTFLAGAAQGQADEGEHAVRVGGDGPRDRFPRTADCGAPS